MFAAQSTLVDAHSALLRSILNALDDGRIEGAVATGLVRALGNVALAVADKKTLSALDALEAFIGEVNREQGELPHDLTRDLLDGAARARVTLSGR